MSKTKQLTNIFLKEILGTKFQNVVQLFLGHCIFGLGAKAWTDYQMSQHHLLLGNL